MDLGSFKEHSVEIALAAIAAVFFLASTLKSAHDKEHELLHQEDDRMDKELVAVEHRVTQLETKHDEAEKHRTCPMTCQNCPHRVGG